MNPEPSVAPYWNIVSIVLPVAATLAGAGALKASSFGDYGGAIGGALKTFVAIGGVCVLGEAAAIAALAKGERMAWLSVLGAVANLMVILPAFYLASRMD